MMMEFSEEWRNNKPLSVAFVGATTARENFMILTKGLVLSFFLYTYIVETL